MGHPTRHFLDFLTAPAGNHSTIQIILTSSQHHTSLGVERNDESDMSTCTDASRIYDYFVAASFMGASIGVR
jgi:hypothetical protein